MVSTIDPANLKPIDLTTSSPRAQCIQPSQAESLRQACSEASMQNVNDALRPFFSTWQTSLVGSDLERLKSMSTNRRLCSLIETLVIRDECNAVDPFIVPELPSMETTYNIWPRDHRGIVIANKIGIADLSQMLRERLLCPKTIKVVDYRIEPSTFLLEPEMARIRRLIGDVTPAAAEPVPLAALVRDVIESANLDVESVVFGFVDAGWGENCALNSALFKERYPNGMSIGGPVVRNTEIKISTAYQGEETRSSMLHDADLQLGCEATSYWVGQIFYEATGLKELKLSIKSPQDLNLDAKMVVPAMTSFSLSGTSVSVNDLQAMLASSKQSLKHMNLSGNVLKQGSTWREILSFIAHEYQALESFRLGILREVGSGSPAVDFRKAKNDPALDQYAGGLQLREVGLASNKRVTRLAYTGVDAGKVLEIVSAHGYKPESY
jgi:hypothetical protein